MNQNRLDKLGDWKAPLVLLAFALLTIQTAGVANMASTTTTTHTRTKITTTLTETTTATSSALGSRPFLVLVVLLAAAASIAVVGGYLWGKRRARKHLLGAST